MIVESNLITSKILKIYTIQMPVVQIYPNNMIVDLHKCWVAKMFLIDLLVISKHWETQELVK